MTSGMYLSVEEVQRETYMMEARDRDIRGWHFYRCCDVHLIMEIGLREYGLLCYSIVYS